MFCTVGELVVGTGSPFTSDYLPYLIDQPFLMPPDLRGWLPEDDLACFVNDTARDGRVGPPK
jgi:hypothetical protein